MSEGINIRSVDWRLREMLGTCREKFLFYEQQHMAKDTPESAAKAAVNAKMAQLIDEALALPNQSTESVIAQHVAEERQRLINTPETADFLAGVALEAAHQRERWDARHDAGKSPFDWFWLVGYLAQKAATAEVGGEVEKAKHHTISTAAALGNWHAALARLDNRMRPGIAEPEVR